MNETKTISGRVISEAGTPIPDLLVSLLYTHALPEGLRSSDMPARPQANRRSPEELSASRGVIPSSDMLQRDQYKAAYVADAWQEIQGDRLGSALTDKYGRFELAYEDSEFRRRGVERPPDPLLLVTTPEEPNTKPLAILHASADVGHNAGQTEARTIQVSAQELEEARVLTRGGQVNDIGNMSVLKAQANLSTLSSNAELNAALIDKGYTTVSAIADAPRADFLGAIRDRVGDFKAARIQVMARAQRNFLDNVRTGIRANSANSTTPTAKAAPTALADPLTNDDRCECKDCESAISPLAYLVDLLDFAMKRLTDMGNSLNLQSLARLLYQPIDKLTYSCDSVETQVHQVRICIEVLRSYLLTFGTTSVTGEKEYRQAAYSTLLNKIGTSYEEIRLARTAKNEKRKNLAERLGLDLESGRPDHLDALLLDPDAQEGQPNALTEAALEKLFGLVDTRRDPLTGGLNAKVGDPQNQIIDWNLFGVEREKNTDTCGKVYATLHAQQFIPPDPSSGWPGAFMYSVWLYRDAQRTQPVAFGQLLSDKTTGSMTLSAQNGSGLSGSIQIAYTADSDTIEFQYFFAGGQLLCWRLEHLRTLWAVQDRPPLPNAGWPLIDPDLISIGNLRKPNPGEAPFDLLQARRTWVDNTLSKLAADHTSQGLTYILEDALVKPLPNLGALQSVLTKGNDVGAVEVAKTTITGTLNLTIESFIRLMDIKAKSDKNQTVEQAEWDEFHAILAQAKKIKQFQSWIAEEQAKKVVLGPDQFWIALENPPLRKWLATEETRQRWQQALLMRSQLPIIDPDLIGQGDFKAQSQSNPAYEVWQRRHDDSKTQRDAWNSQKQAGALDTLLTSVLDASVDLSGLRRLADSRKSGKKIDPRLDQLSLKQGEFSRLLSLCDLINSGSSVLDSEWQELFSILLQVRKRRQFAAWRDEEEQKNILLSPDYFRIPPTPPFGSSQKKPTFELQPWLATQQERSDWQDTLQARLDQERATKDSSQAVVDACEEATLPALRDALLMATYPGESDLQSKAKYFTEEVMIDAQTGGCQKTTRLAQAIESIQGLILSASSGQNSYIQIDAQYQASFDKEWEWMGSYPTYRSASLVTLWPENILLPSLRRRERETPAFRSLVESLRSHQRLDPETACKAASTYSDYFRDVCNLTVEASCVALTRIHRGSCRNKTISPNGMPLLYMFARTNEGKVYWCTHDPEDTSSGYNQTFWEVIPGFDNVQKILGAVPYLPNDKQHQILLFAMITEKGVQKLVFKVYDLLNNQNWDGDPVDLSQDFPKEWRNVSAVVEQHDDVQRPPVLLIKTDITAPTTPLWKLKVRSLNKAGTGWEGGEFGGVGSGVNADPTDLYSLVHAGFNKFGFPIWLAFIRNKDQITVLNLESEPNGSWWVNEGTAISDKLARWAGVIVLPGYQKVPGLDGQIITVFTIFAYVREWVSVQGQSPVSYGPLRYDQLRGTKVKLPLWDQPRLKHNAVHSGYDPKSSGRLLAYQLHMPSEGYRARFSSTGETLSKTENAAIAPNVPGPYEIPEKMSESDLQQRKTEEVIATVVLTQPLYDSYNWVFNWVVLEEAYYFVPMFLALELHKAREYTAALNWFRTVYNYTAPTFEERSIYFEFGAQWPGFFAGIRNQYSYADWLLDPLNPHAIAMTRVDTYRKFTVLALARCWLDFADEEFTRDTPTSIPRAREFYMAVVDLLDQEGLNKGLADRCQDIIKTVDIEVPDQLAPALANIKQELADITRVSLLKKVTEEVRQALQSDTSWEARFGQARQVVRLAKDSLPAPPTIAEVLEQRPEAIARADTTLLARPELAQAANKLGNVAGQDFLQGVASVSGLSPERLENECVDLPWLTERAWSATAEAQTGVGQSTAHPKGRDPVDALARTTKPDDLSSTTARVELPQINPLIALEENSNLPSDYVPHVSPQFCVPSNPMVGALRLRAELNLFKLRHCRNISGMERAVDPYGAPTDIQSGLPTIGAGGQLVLPGTTVIQPTPYRYSVLIERAKQLVGLAQQIEASLLSALEKLDAEAYSILKARQDVSLTHAGVRLQDLRVKEAEAGVDLANLQQQRAQSQVDHYTELLQKPISDLEQLSLGFQAMAAGLYLEASIASAIPNIIAGMADGVIIDWGGIMSNLAQASSTTSAMFSTMASYERRSEQWEFDQSLAKQDVGIGAQQVKIADDHVRVAGQERNIAQIQVDNAEAGVNFLATKFTNVELYEWMINTLEGVYSFFLQQATAVAKLAAGQLAFERQEVPPSFIQADYWEVPTDGGMGGSSTDGHAPDRHGLTGSARLLEDIYKLDQYAFETNKRKLQLSKTISLSRLAPVEFQRFRETGVMRFTTPMELFDREFPGHYLRLISKVSTTVVALVAPSAGIRATLTSDRLSRVVIGGDTFQTVPIQHGPDQVALSSPRNATGLFELDLQSEMLRPFENIGVDTRWELRMPKAANLFNYDTIADVLITIDYTALNSFDYREQVIQTLKPTLSADRPLSFRQQFADQWYDLHNPNQTATLMVVRFSTRREDFPPNIEDLKIEHVVLYFVRAAGKSFEVPASLRFTEQGGAGPVGGEATSVDGVVSTRRGNAGSWTPMIGKSLVGEWEMDLCGKQDSKDSCNPDILDHFRNEEIEDILFVITYSARTPELPA